MNRKIVAVWLILVMALGSIGILVDIAPRIQAPSVLYVGGIGPENYSTIQEGVNAANDGDTVFVYNGTYNEYVLVNRTINLIGQDSTNTTIAGTGWGDVVQITSDWVNITGFTVSLGGWEFEDSGIKLNNVRNCNISYNTISLNYNYGICLYSSMNNTILGNDFFSNYYGLSIEYSKGNILSGNNFSDNSRDSIYIYYSNLISILNNNISNCRYGITLGYSKYINVNENRMMGNSVLIFGDSLEHWNSHSIDISNTVNNMPVYYWKNQTGGMLPNNAGQIILANCTDVIVENQELYNCTVGILAGFSRDINITRNNASKTQYGIYLYSSNYTTILDNNVTDSEFGIQLYSSHNNTLSVNIILDCNIGIDLHSSCNFNTIVRNFLNNNTEGMHIYFSVGNSIDKNNVSNNRNGIYLERSSSSIVTDNDFFSNQWRALNIYSADDCIITRNTACYNGYAFYIHTSRWANITNNIMIENGIFIDGGLVDHWDSHNIDTSNTINSNPVYYFKNQIGGSIPSDAGEVILGNCENFDISNLNLTNCSVGVELGFSHNNSITNNNVSSNYAYGIFLESSNWNNIVGNNASNCYSGIYTYQSFDNTIENNIANTNRYRGINLFIGDRNKIIGNSASWNYEEGIRLSSSSYNEVMTNTVLENHYGISLAVSSFSNVTRNFVSSNTRFGISIWESSHNNVTYNTVSYNQEYGIRLASSSNIRVYHNNIISNAIQAIDNRDTNYWDNGYPSGGNFWSDYAGIDLNSTSKQDVPPPDGIGDTAYIIDSDSQDDYPLMKTIENYTILKQGWNLVSLPLIQTDQNLTKVLELMNGCYNAVQWYDVTDTNDPWKHHKIGKLFGDDLFELNETMSFWIHITQPGDMIFLYNGSNPTVNLTIPIHQGWNMVGYPSLSNHNRTEGLNNITFGTDVDAIQWYDAAKKTWHDMGPDDFFVPGRGYWVHSNFEMIWEVPL